MAWKLMRKLRMLPSGPACCQLTMLSRIPGEHVTIDLCFFSSMSQSVPALSFGLAWSELVLGNAATGTSVWLERLTVLAKAQVEEASVHATAAGRQGRMDWPQLALLPRGLSAWSLVNIIMVPA